MQGPLGATEHSTPVLLLCAFVFGAFLHGNAKYKCGCVLCAVRERDEELSGSSHLVCVCGVIGCSSWGLHRIAVPHGGDA